MVDHHVIQNCIDWNRKQLDWAWKARQSEDRATAIEACRNAQRFACNITALQAQL